jgi:glutamate 5-kinase
MEVILVSSGAIGVGLGKLGMDPARPDDISKRQALASIGQCELMFIYDKLFGEYNHIVSQVLLTSDVFGDKLRRTNAENTFSQLLSLGVIPIVNENDTVATDELEGANIGDNDTLSAIVTANIGADLLILLSDIDGLYNKDPHKYSDAVLISRVDTIDDNILALAGEKGSNLGTGGMVTKLHAAEITMAAGIDTIVMNGENPTEIYKALDGKQVGTFFKGK